MTNKGDIFLIAHPRSGTHALTSKFSQKPDIFVFGEIFNPAPESDIYPANYYHFLRAMQDTPLASPRNAETRFNAYLTYLKGRARNLRYLIDIKYDTLHLFDIEHREIAAPPGIFSMLIKHNLPIIHLKRNVLHIYYSALHAKETNQYQVMAGEEAKKQSLHIDIEDMLGFLARKTFEQEQVSQFVRGTDSYLEVWYEDLFGPDGASAFDRVSDFVGVPALGAEDSAFKKQITTPYDQLIENYDQVVQAVRRSPYAQLLEPVRVR